MLGATFGGVAGGLFAAFQGFVSPGPSLMESIAVLTMIVFGGMGNLAGVDRRALALTALPEVLRLRGGAGAAGGVRQGHPDP